MTSLLRYVPSTGLFLSFNLFYFILLYFIVGHVSSDTFLKFVYF